VEKRKSVDERERGEKKERMREEFEKRSNERKSFKWVSRGGKEMRREEKKRGDYVE
jgi:hypothetical protein